MFKISKTTEVKIKENRNNLTIRKRAGAITALLSAVVSSLMFFDVHIKFFAEIVCNTINFCNFGSSNHKDCFYVIYLISNNKYTKNNPFLLLKNNKFLRRTQVNKHLSVERFASLHVGTRSVYCVFEMVEELFYFSPALVFNIYVPGGSARYCA